MPSIYKIILFVIGTIGILWVSRTSLRNPQHHGFYRFIVWAGILGLFLMVMDAWFVNPFSVRLLQRNYLIRLELRLDDIRHAADNTNLHPIGQVEEIQAGAAQNEMHPLSFQRL